MIYDLKSKVKQQQAIEKLKWLIEKEARIELTKKNPKKTLSQNNYLYLILSYFAVQTGYNLNEVKQYFKMLNRNIFAYMKNGDEYFRSIAELDKEEMMIVIDKFIIFSRDETGILLPDPNDLPFLDEIQNEVEINRKDL